MNKWNFYLNEGINPPDISRKDIQQILIKLKDKYKGVTKKTHDRDYRKYLDEFTQSIWNDKYDTIRSEYSRDPSTDKVMKSVVNYLDNSVLGDFYSIDDASLNIYDTIKNIK